MYVRIPEGLQDVGLHTVSKLTSELNILSFTLHRRPTTVCTYNEFVAFFNAAIHLYYI